MNIQLETFLKASRRELKYTVPHRRGIILGYIKVNLDSLLRDNIICLGEYKDSCLQLDIYYDKIQCC